MVAIAPKAVKLWGRGQLTIPKEVRQALKLEDESQLNVFVVGRCLIMTPKPLLRSSLAKDVQKSMKAQGLSLENLLRSLKEDRRLYNKEAHGG